MMAVKTLSYQHQSFKVGVNEIAGLCISLGGDLL
jgi:hypothetical protein